MDRWTRTRETAASEQYPWAVVTWQKNTEGMLIAIVLKVLADELIDQEVLVTQLRPRVLLCGAQCEVAVCPMSACVQCGLEIGEPGRPLP
jgi:hypothetical protein